MELTNTINNDIELNNKQKSFFNSNLGKIVKYASKKPYDVNNHYKLLVRKSTGKLDNDILNLFKMIASNMCEYLNRKNNYNDLIKYLSTDIKNNSK